MLFCLERFYPLMFPHRVFPDILIPVLLQTAIFRNYISMIRFLSISLATDMYVKTQLAVTTRLDLQFLLAQNWTLGKQTSPTLRSHLCMILEKVTYQHHNLSVECCATMSFWDHTLYRKHGPSGSLTMWVGITRCPMSCSCKWWIRC